MGGNKMLVPTPYWGMGALTLYCMHFGVSSRRCIRRAVTTPYWGMEALTSHGNVLGSLLSTLCTESVSVGVVVRREVSFRRLAEPYIGLSWPRLSSFPPSVLISTLSCVWISPSWLIGFLMRACLLGQKVVNQIWRGCQTLSVGCFD